MSNESDRWRYGLTSLRNQLGVDHPQRLELHTLEARLVQNLNDERAYGSSDNLRADRARILGALNKLALDTLHRSFNELCEPPADEQASPPVTGPGSPFLGPVP